MVREGIVLGYKISQQGIEVDREKIKTIEKLPPPSSMKAIWSLLGHASFHRCFTKDFLKITQPLTKLLEKDMLFEFTMECLAFETLKDKLVKALIVIAPDWNIPFEIMCDASDHTVKAILGQRRD